MPFTMDTHFNMRRQRALSNASTGSHGQLAEFGSLQECLLAIWEEVVEYPSSAYFLNKVPDYFLDFQPYVDLNTVKRNILRGYFEDATSFLQQMAVMINNMRRASEHDPTVRAASLEFQLGLNVVLQRYNLPSASMFNSMVENTFGGDGMSLGGSRGSKKRTLSHSGEAPKRKNRRVGSLGGAGSSRLGGGAHGSSSSSSLSSSSAYGQYGYGMESGMGSGGLFAAPQPRYALGSSRGSSTGSSSSSQHEVLVSGEMARLHELKRRVQGGGGGMVVEVDGEEELLAFHSLPLESLPFTVEFGSWAAGELELSMDESDSSDSASPLEALTAEIEGSPRKLSGREREELRVRKAAEDRARAVRRQRRNMKLNRDLSMIPEERIVDLLAILKECTRSKHSTGGELLFDLNELDERSLRKLRQLVRAVKQEVLADRMQQEEMRTTARIQSAAVALQQQADRQMFANEHVSLQVKEGGDEDEEVDVD